MNDMLVVTILAVLFVLIIWIMNILCRSTEKQTRRSAVNLNKRNKIKPDVACTKQHALPRADINDGFSTASGEDLNNQSFLRLMADEKNLIELEKERIANELSLVQSQLTDSSSKLQMFQNVHDELAATKRELENNKREMTDIKEINLRLTNDDSRLRRTIEDMDRIIIEDRDRIMASNAIEKNLIVLEKERLANELSLVQSQLTDSHSKVKQFRIESATTKSELEEKKSEMTDMTENNLRLTNENSRLRQTIEDKDRMITLIVFDKESYENELSLLQSQLTFSSNRQMFQNQRDELAITKIELENNKRLMTDITEKNLRLKKDDSRLRRKIEDRDKIIASNAIEKNLIVLDKERLANKLSLLQSQLTDSSSKLQMFQNVHNELAATKSELENNKREMTDIKEINLRLTNDDSRLRRQIEAKDRIIEDRDRIIIEERDRIMASSAIEKNLELEKERLENELSLLQSQLTDSSSKLQMFQNVHNELAATKSELENNKREMTDIKEINLRLTNDDSRLRRQIEAKDRIIEDRDRIIIEERDRIMASSAIEKNLELEKERLENELSLVQSQLKDSHSKVKQFRIESATTKSELEEKKSEMTDMTENNLRLTNENSRLRQTIEDKDRTIRLIVFDKESYANELSLLQSQLTFSSNRQMFQNQRDELSITKIELENNKRLMTDITEKNLRLKKDDSRLRRKIEDRDKIIASNAIEKNLIVLDKERLANKLSLVQSQLRDSQSNQIFQKVHDEIATTKRELEEKKREILRWTENDSQLRRQLDRRRRRPATTATTRETENVCQTTYPDLPPEYENPPSYGASVTARY
ncbi:myosin-11-like [Daphnia pulex]|uniref:myosin-11-like n=1 Tax=Daphnia pulex TaxID=6669 RepID=UPI001EDDE0B5|nr:myosin-11-like [Daphnia pulex]